jgi:hypothetical protein
MNSRTKEKKLNTICRGGIRACNIEKEEESNASITTITSATTVSTAHVSRLTRSSAETTAHNTY